jgi:hypothetical protein
MENTCENTNSEGGFDLVNQDCFINIELKSQADIDKVVSLEKYVTKDNTTILVSSFDFAAASGIFKIKFHWRFNGNRFDFGLAFGKIHSSAFSFH